jgi:phosphoglycerol transferase
MALPRWVFWTGLFGLAAFVVFCTIRDAGLYPAVFADERTYSLYSRLAPVSGSPVPSFLYLTVFRSTNQCGEGWYSCARLGNALFYAGGLALLFHVALRVCRPSLALLVATLAASAPATSYTSYFMPESMYFFGFWLVVWLFVRLETARSIALAAGCALGALALVKAHAIFLIPAATVVLAAIALSDPRPGKWARVATGIVLLGVTFGVVRFGLGGLLAGKSGLSLLGASYGATASSVGGERAQSMVQVTLQSFWGQLQALAVFFALPMAIALHVWPRASSGPLDSRERLHLLTLLVLGTLLVVVAAFTASAVGSGPFETANRLHQRYYCFVFPALVLLVAAELERTPPRLSTLWRVLRGVTALSLGAIAIIGAARGLAEFKPGFADGPDIWGITRVYGVMLGTAIAMAVACALWLRSPKAGALVALLALIPATIVADVKVQRLMVKQGRRPSVFDSAGRAARWHLADKVNQLTVVTEYVPGLYRTAFAIDAADVATMEIKPGQPIDELQLPAERDWVLLIGEGHALPDGAHVELSEPGFTLMQLAPKQAAASH